VRKKVANDDVRVIIMLTVHIPLLSQSASVFLVLGNVGPETLMDNVIDSVRVSFCAVVLYDVRVKRGGENSNLFVADRTHSYREYKATASVML
jgi:hypothetical protein